MKLVTYNLNEYEWLKSPFSEYSGRKIPYAVYDVVNSIGSHFLVILKNTQRKQERILKNIEIAKYPLDMQELSFIMQTLNFNKVVNEDVYTYRMQLKDADALFKQAGVYFRLGLLNSHKSVRFAVLRAYSRIYDFRFVLDEWTDVDVKELQRLADTGISLADIADEMGRTYNEVFNACKRFNIVLLQEKRSYSFWSDGDLDVLRKNVGVLTYKQIQQAYFPNRSLSNLITTASKHGISAGKRGRKKGGKNDL